MPRERLAEVLRRVDPKLRIVEARPWPGKRRTRMNQADWEKAAGVICENCHREVFRSRDGLCIECWEKANEFEIRDKAGVLEFLPESVIMEIVHPVGRLNHLGAEISRLTGTPPDSGDALK